MHMPGDDKSSPCIVLLREPLGKKQFSKIFDSIEEAKDWITKQEHPEDYIIRVFNKPK